jgi:hypothetical protein
MITKAAQCFLFFLGHMFFTTPSEFERLKKNKCGVNTLLEMCRRERLLS